MAASLLSQRRSMKNELRIISHNKHMQDLLLHVDIVAQSETTVLICGETGTGKEVIANTIHRLSGRRNKPFVKVNCAAIPANLLENELFGHAKGAFTGAYSARKGRFEVADGGTLFLDEVGDLPLELQPKLLRALQEREIERLGGSEVIKLDIRVIAATNRNLKQMVEQREFRSDLYYRLNVIPLRLPPLRERREDIIPLTWYFLKKHTKKVNRIIDIIPEEVFNELTAYDWPGNIRELENVIERSVLLTQSNCLSLHLNYSPISAFQPVEKTVGIVTNNGQVVNSRSSNDDERSRIVQILQETNGIIAGPRGAAQRLGMKRTTLISRMQRLGISSKYKKS